MLTILVESDNVEVDPHECISKFNIASWCCEEVSKHVCCDVFDEESCDTMVHNCNVLKFQYGILMLVAFECTTQSFWTKINLFYIPHILFECLNATIPRRFRHTSTSRPSCTRLCMYFRESTSWFECNGEWTSRFHLPETGCTTWISHTICLHRTVYPRYMNCTKLNLYFELWKHTETRNLCRHNGNSEQTSLRPQPTRGPLVGEGGLDDSVSISVLYLQQCLIIKNRLFFHFGILDICRFFGTRLQETTWWFKCYTFVWKRTIFRSYNSETLSSYISTAALMQLILHVFP